MAEETLDKRGAQIPQICITTPLVEALPTSEAIRIICGLKMRQTALPGFMHTSEE